MVIEAPETIDEPIVVASGVWKIIFISTSKLAHNSALLIKEYTRNAFSETLVYLL